jgi:hypothetical protein
VAVAVPLIKKRTIPVTIKFNILRENLKICMDLNRMKIAACDGNEFMNLFSRVSLLYIAKAFLFLCFYLQLIQ